MLFEGVVLLFYRKLNLDIFLPQSTAPTPNSTIHMGFSNNPMSMQVQSQAL